MRVANWKRFGIFIITFMVTISILMILSIGKQEVSNQDYDSWESTGRVPAFLKTRKINRIWEQVHKMSNHLILADDIRGYSDITEERVNKLIIEVHEGEYKFEESSELIEILKRWKKADFSEADDDHNKIWTRLNGTIGKAYGVRNDLPVW